jgi:hypothetical protein
VCKNIKKGSGAKGLNQQQNIPTDGEERRNMKPFYTNILKLILFS